MLKYRHVCTLIVLVSGFSAAASIPSADQLLDRFAVNADSHSGSFMVRLENHKEIIIHRMEHAFFKPGKRKEYYSLDCRWDGKHIRLRKHSRVGPGTTKINLGERSYFESMLYDTTRQIIYRGQEDQLDTNTVSYYDQGRLREACFKEVEYYIGSWVWGYFAEENPSRIDGFLRGSTTAKVRPKTEQFDGTECHVLEADSSHAKYTIWFAPRYEYNFVRLVSEKPDIKIEISNRRYKEFGEAWLPTEMEWTVQINQTTQDVTYSQKTTVTDFKLNPDHEKLQSFVMDDIPEGTRVEFHSGKGYKMPGAFQWRGGKPTPIVKEDTLARLNWLTEHIRSRDSNTDGYRFASETMAEKQTLTMPHCGLHCLYLILRMHDQDPNLKDLIIPDYLDTPEGSTLTALKTAVSDFNLHAEILLRANARMLSYCPDPTVLRIKGNNTSKKYDHYVLFLGMEGRRAKICDPAGVVQMMSLDELASRWDGSALVVAKQPVEAAGVVRHARIHLFLKVGFGIFVLFVIGRARQYCVFPKLLSTISGRSALSVMQFGGFVLASIVIGLTVHSICWGGFLRYPDGVVSTQEAHVSDFITRIDLMTAKRMKDDGSVFIDARRKPDFEAGHVEEAISIAVDTNDVLLKDATKAVPVDSSVVIYCQSNRCQYADIIAGRLRLLGYSDVSIFEGGWVEWSTGKPLPKPRSRNDPNSGKWRINSDGTVSPEE